MVVLLVEGRREGCYLERSGELMFRAIRPLSSGKRFRRSRMQARYGMKPQGFILEPAARLVLE